MTDQASSRDWASKSRAFGKSKKSIKQASKRSKEAGRLDDDWNWTWGRQSGPLISRVDAAGHLYTNADETDPMLSEISG